MILPVPNTVNADSIIPVLGLTSTKKNEYEVGDCFQFEFNEISAY